ncbi:tripartite tricarboxylate transporter substrate binding protein [Pseudorhodoferax sp. Leaf265]|uniref:Bug family tripartite tricarboxylate transporter substrate binding protein n=1 Tax=Pseudorhodoferax sp. Leaf265 TaxID=1736315 RepID=UPI00070024E3|nr:tripartite tricarboxylate transporter substrate binding protein [Pseudorhodoferax sp. Leaf265]KQP03663.1 ABC transporter substrate-binding protein [Pseudorhodoferax sp. Leaf265]PZP97983.1 MAG: tripartite tricarboxylate transporter substrate binding protein [Variovorax paradoxus]PZQ09293.1 MAG: tripartite tricarboxylate transporter substrate binding protein [Variovorax paradoxus]
MRILATLLSAAVLAFAPCAQAESFPDKPVMLVVPFPPGGPTDAMARTIAAEMKDRLGQPVVVENRAGAGGNIGAEYVARAAADGQTLLFGTSGPLAINASLYRKSGYDPIKSFAPVIQVGHLPNILVVHPSVPAQNVKELVAYAKANPGKLSYASSGNGASSHLAGVLFNEKAGTDIQHIPYKGTGPALNDLLGGQVGMSFTDVLTALPYVKTGKLRALGIATAQRSQALPELPTVAEQGVPGYDVSVFFGIVAPAGTPADRIAKLNKAFVEVLASPKVKELFATQGLEGAPDHTPAQLARFIAAQKAAWAAVVKQSGAQLD